MTLLQPEAQTLGFSHWLLLAALIQRRSGIHWRM